MKPLTDLLRHWVPHDALPRRWWRQYRFLRQIRKLAGTQLTDAFAKAYPEAYFVQVGSNDGEQLDPLRKAILSRQWRGIMIEPVPYVYARLQRNYGHLADRVRLANVAIAAVDGELPFYHLAPVADYMAEGLPKWYDALGSFRRDVLLKHQTFIPDIEQRIVCAQLPTLTFATLFSRAGVDRIDLLHTDVEGFDYELLKLFDFEHYQPRLLIFESLHLSPDELAGCKAYLHQFGYETMDEAMDTWCLNLNNLRERDKPLIKLWHRLREERHAGFLGQLS